MTKPKLSGRISRPVDEGSNKLPQLGKIKTGMKHPERGYPMSLDHFIAKGKYAERFHEAYGEKPNKIGIVFTSDNLSDVCYERMELRDPANGKLLGYGDGKTYFLWQKTKGQYVEKTPTTEAQSKAIQEMGTWRPILTLKFIIPKINDVFGIWVLETMGINSSIPNIRDTFDSVMNSANTVINIPFDLTVEKVTSQTPGETRTFPVVSLVPNVGAERLEDIHKYLNAGNSVRGIKELIESNSNGDAKALPGGTQPEIKQLNSGNPQKDLFQNNTTNHAGRK